MAVSWLRRAAAAAPVPVFAAVGKGWHERTEDLCLNPALEWVASPRHASVLLVAGEPRAADLPALRRVHDQIPPPRATLWWGAAPASDFPAAASVASEDDPRPTLAALYRGLVTGERAGESHVLPDEPPNPWRGLGDRGHGGEGMMGGVPFGRPMPMPPEPDLRDGLALDAYTARYGPYLPIWPPGLVLELTLQGDVIQRGRLLRAPFIPVAERCQGQPLANDDERTAGALGRALAGHHLRCVARLLCLLELGAWGERCRRVAQAVERGERVDIAALCRAIERTGAVAAIPPGLGQVPQATASRLGGVAARAAVEAVDAHQGASAYRGAGVATIMQSGGDARARFTQWLHEAEQAAQRIDTGPPPSRLAAAECRQWAATRPGGDHAARLVAEPVNEFLAGLEWGAARLLLASFDELALARLMAAEPEPTERQGGAG